MITTAATWLLTSVIHGLILGTLAVVAVPRLSRRPRVRVVLWRVALLAPLLTAAAAVAVDAVDQRPTIDLSAPLRPHLPPSWRRMEVRMLEDRQIGGPLVRHTVVDDPLAQALAAILFTLAAIAAGAALARFVRGRSRALAALGPRDRLSLAVSIPYPPLSKRSITLSASSSIVSPVALRHDEICVPMPAFASLPAESQRAVLLHEVSHIERRDPLWLDVVSVLGALTPWLPLARFILRAHARDTELAADEGALELGAEPPALVAALAWIAGMLEREPALAGVWLAHGESALVQRGHRILALGGNHPNRAGSWPSMGTAWLLVAIGAAVLMALPLPTPGYRVSRGAFGLPLAGPPGSVTVGPVQQTLVTKVDERLGRGPKQPR